MLSCEDEVSSFSVHTLITPSNIYANLQSQAHTAVIHFDITVKIIDFSLTITVFIQRKDAWRPLFDKEISLPSVQPQSLNYSLMEEDSIVELRYDHDYWLVNMFCCSSSLERALKLKVDESRSFGLPQWNLLTSRYLPSSVHPFSSLLLFRTLRESINSSSPVSSLSDVLSRSQSSFVTSILVLSTSFTSISDTVEQIITSRVHLSAHPQVIFI